MDLIFWAFKNETWTEEECNDFISSVLKKGGRLPCKTITCYIEKYNFKD